MKNLYLVFFLIFIGYSGYSQYQIDFDSFTTGDVSNQSTYLELWPDPTASPTDPQVTTTYSFSTPHSMNVRELSGGVEDDILFNLGNKDSGIWVVKWMMYVPTGKVGYWNIQENASINPIVQHNNEIFVGSTASGGTANVITYTESSTTSTYTVSYPSDSWFEVITTIDFSTTEISIEIDGNSLITNHTYPGLQLGAIDFYSVDLNTSFFIDDFKLYEGCYIPGNLTLDNTTDVSADFSWNVVSTETGGYNYLVMQPGDDPNMDTPIDSGTTLAGASTLQITGLSPLTSYDFYLQSNCDNAEISDWTNMINFTSSASCSTPTVTTYPYLENFENDSQSLGCWSQVNEIGSADWTYSEGSTSGSINSAVSGVQNIVFVSQSSVGDPITKYISPVFDLSSLTNPILKFYFAQEDYFGDYNTLKVYYRISDQDSWVELEHYDQSEDIWTQVELPLPNPTSTYQIAFEGINNFGRPNVIDDVEIDEKLSTYSSTIEGFSYYPNPTKNTVNFIANTNIQELKVFDVLGKEVYSVTPLQTDFEMNLSNLNSGVYFIKATINNQTKSFKIIKE